jgi:hypothetical protein
VSILPPPLLLLLVAATIVKENRCRCPLLLRTPVAVKRVYPPSPLRLLKWFGWIRSCWRNGTVGVPTRPTMTTDVDAHASRVRFAAFSATDMAKARRNGIGTTTPMTAIGVEGRVQSDGVFGAFFWGGWCRTRSR